MYKFLDLIKEILGSLRTAVAGSGADWLHAEY